MLHHRARGLCLALGRLARLASIQLAGDEGPVKDVIEVHADELLLKSPLPHLVRGQNSRVLALYYWLSSILSTTDLLLWRGHMGNDDDYDYDYRMVEMAWRSGSTIASTSYDVAVFVRYRFDYAILRNLMRDWSSWVRQVGN